MKPKSSGSSSGSFARPCPYRFKKAGSRSAPELSKAGPQHARRLQKTEAGEREVLLTRRRLDAYFLPGMLLAVATCAYVYHVTGDASVFLKLFAIPAIWLVVRFLLQRKGEVRKRLSSDPRGRFVLFAYLWLFGGTAVFLLLKAFVPNAALAFMIPFFVITFAGIFIWARRLDRRQRREELEAIEQIRDEAQLLPQELAEPWS